MSRAQRDRDEADNAPPEQIEHLAFTIRGHAMEDGMKDRKESIEYICAYSPKGQYEKAVKEAVKEGTPLEEVFRTDLGYSNREKGDAEPGIKKYMVVGYAQRFPSDDIQKVAPWQKKQKAVGNKAPSAEHIIKWDPKEPPVLVVTEVLNQRPDGIQLWALIKPKNGVCVPHQISQRVVFYRSQFRDNTTDIRNRGTNWNTKVAFHSVKPGLMGAPLTEKQQKFRHARDPVKLVFNPRVSLSNELLSLGASYRHTKDPWFLKEIQAVLRAVDSDVDCRPLPDNAGLRLFVESKEPIDEEQSQMVVRDFLEMWPGTKHIVVENVKTIQHVMLKERLHLEYHFIKPFLAEACWLMGEGKVDEEGLAVKVKEVLGTASRMCGPVESTPAIPANEQNAILQVFRTKLKEMSKAAVEIEEKMKSSYGDTAFEHSSQDIWAKFGDAIDIDTARAAWCQEVKLVIAAARQKEVGLRGMIDDMIAILDRLNL